MSELLHYKKNNFLSKEEAKEIFDILYATVDWQVFPPAPNSRKVFKYRPPTDFDPIINKLIAKVEKECNTHVMGVFLNLYENGGDYCPYHKDRYGMDAYTISLGSSRDFLIKKDGTGTRAEKITLDPGDMYFMSTYLHQQYRHSIPKRKSAGPRISIVLFASNLNMNLARVV